MCWVGLIGFDSLQLPIAARICVSHYVRVTPWEWILQLVQIHYKTDLFLFVLHYSLL